MLLAARDDAVGIVKRQVADQVEAIVERSGLDGRVLEHSARVVVIDCIRRAHRQPAVAVDVPGRAHAR
jgi:hypothetical protein